MPMIVRGILFCTPSGLSSRTTYNCKAGNPPVLIGNILFRIAFESLWWKHSIKYSSIECWGLNIELPGIRLYCLVVSKEAKEDRSGAQECNKRFRSWTYAGIWRKLVLPSVPCEARTVDTDPSSNQSLGLWAVARPAPIQKLSALTVPARQWHVRGTRQASPFSGTKFQLFVLE